MARQNNLNVYTGPDSLKNYFDPDTAPPIPLVEIPACLNPYRSKGVRIYAKMMSMHPANNVKAMPAMNLLQHSVVPDKTKTIIEYSSGSTVISMAMVSRIYHNIDDVRAFLSNKTSRAKLRLMQFFGLDITLFGGPSQPEPLDDRGGIQRARGMAQDSDEIVNPNQYENDDNWQTHIRWTGPQILRQLPEINVICAGMGTSGTMTGLGTFFKDKKPDVTRLAVCTAPGDRVPGPRSYALLAPVEFPWKEAVDEMEEVGSFDSYSLSLELCRQGLVCGPSSGFNLKGLHKFIERREKEGRLDELRGPDGDIHCVFMVCDGPYQYIDEYFAKLGPQAFPKINNELLTTVDIHRYDESWELSPLLAATRFFRITDHIDSQDKPTTSLTPLPTTSVLDLRNTTCFASWHLPSSTSIPLSTLTPDSASPFFEPKLLAAQWTELEALFKQHADLVEKLAGRQVVVLCYDGDTARVAVSVLRARGVEASSIRGGVKTLWKELPTLRASERNEQQAAHEKGIGLVDIRVQTGMKSMAQAEVQEVPVRTGALQ